MKCCKCGAENLTMQAASQENSTIGSRLRSFLRTNDLSQNDLAKKIGVSKNTVLSIVNDASSPRTEFWTRLDEECPAADVPYIVFGSRPTVGFGESLPTLREDPVRYLPSSRMRCWVGEAGHVTELESFDDFFDMDYIEDYPDINRDKLMANYVQGTSMESSIYQGEMLMCE